MFVLLKNSTPNYRYKTQNFKPIKQYTDKKRAVLLLGGSDPTFNKPMSKGFDFVAIA